MPKGIAASPGIVIGTVYLFEQTAIHLQLEPISEEEVAGQLERVKDAVEKSKAQLLALQEQIAQNLGPEKAGIMDAHLMILEDVAFISEVENMIRTEKVKAEWAISQVGQMLQATFESVDDEYMRERAADVRDVTERIVKNALNIPIKTLSNIGRPVVVVTHDLAPTDTAQFDRDHVMALVADMGGRTSHTAIMARSLELPAVVGLGDFSGRVSDGDTIIVDGCKGEVILNPVYDENGDTWYIGIMGGTDLKICTVPETFQYGFYVLEYTVKATAKSLVMLVRGQLSADAVSGPVGMVQYVDQTYDAVKDYGMSNVIINMVNIAMMLSISLGVMNLLPIPALDGGRLVFLIVEAIRKKRIEPELEAKIHFTGLMLLLLLMVFVMLNDVRKIFF